MDELTQLAELLQRKNDLLFLLDRHAQNRELIWEDDNEGYYDYINAALDEINEVNQLIQELTGEDL